MCNVTWVKVFTILTDFSFFFKGLLSNRLAYVQHPRPLGHIRYITTWLQ